MKGSNSAYRPAPGTTCLISPPNSDDDNGYTFGEFEVLWTNETFIVYRHKDCWPCVNKWDHVICKPTEVSA
jgi:hypothetical protein